MAAAEEDQVLGPGAAGHAGPAQGPGPEAAFRRQSGQQRERPHRRVRGRAQGQTVLHLPQAGQEAVED